MKIYKGEEVIKKAFHVIATSHSLSLSKRFIEEFIKGHNPNDCKCIFVKNKYKDKLKNRIISIEIIN